MALPATDTFTTGSDAALTTYSASWSVVNGAFRVLAASDDFHSNTNNQETAARWNADTPNANQYAQIKINAIASSFLVGPACRVSSSAHTLYGYYADSAATYLFKVVAGTWTQLGSTNFTAVTVNMVLRLEANSTTLTPKRDGVTDAIGAQTDSSITAANFLGICGYDNGSTSRGDTWEGGNIGGAYTLTCAAGSYAITGNAQSLLWKHLLTPDVGSYAITGNAVGLAHGYPMAITTGVYVITGNDQSLLWKHLISLTSGSYAIIGNDTGLYRGYPLTITAGSYALIGNDVALLWKRLLAVDVGSYTITGNATGLYRGYPMAVVSGNYVITGNDQGLLWKHFLAITAGDYAITGNDAGLLWKHILSLASGSYVITGNDVNLVYAPTGAYTIACAMGVYDITGNAVTFARTYILLIASGVYSITGYAVDLDYYTGQAVSAGYSKFPPHYRRIIEEPFPADDPEALLIWWYLVNRG